MNNTRILQIVALIVVVVLAFFVIKRNPSNEPIVQITNYEECVQAGGNVVNGVCTAPNGTCCFSEKPPVAQPNVIVDTPKPMDLITSPLVVKGRAKGTWFSEANLPVTLKDGKGNILAQKGFQSIGDWMTTDYVEFADSLPFVTPQTQYGTLVISKDNPSGDPANDEDFPVPVRFW